MSRTMTKGVRFSILSILLLAFCAFLPPRLSVAQSGPGLVNADFEQGFTMRGAPEVEVATGWEVSYLEGDHPFCRHPCHRPEYKPEAQQRYRTNGEFSQRWFSTFARQFGVIWQRVQVEPGQWYRFSCDAYVISDPPGGHAAMVGIQPWGAGVFSRQMVWGAELQQRDTWQRVEVTAQAWSSTIVVALGANNAWPTKNNTSYWDGCTIERVEIGDCPDCPDCEDCPDCPPCSGEGCDLETVKAALLDVLRGLRWGVVD